MQTTEHSHYFVDETERSVPIKLQDGSYTLLLNYELFTFREAEVIVLLLCGYTNRQIAEELIIEVGTVKNHVHSIFEKISYRPARRPRRNILVKHYLLNTGQLVAVAENTQIEKSKKLTESLTSREAVIYALIGKRKSIPEITELLQVDERQLLNYLYLILKKVAEDFDGE